MKLKLKYRQTGNITDILEYLTWKSTIKIMTRKFKDTRNNTINLKKQMNMAFFSFKNEEYQGLTLKKY